MITTLLVQLIRFYQLTSQFRQQLYVAVGIPPHSCRHQPSCSQYSIRVLKQYGTIHGLRLATKRLLSCHPFSTTNP